MSTVYVRQTSRQKSTNCGKDKQMSDIVGCAILACVISVGFWIVQLITADKESKSLDRISDILEDMLKQMEKKGDG